MRVLEKDFQEVVKRGIAPLICVNQSNVYIADCLLHLEI